MKRDWERVPRRRSVKRCQGRLLWRHDVGDPEETRDRGEDKPAWWTRSRAGSEGLRLYPQAGGLGEEGYRVPHRGREAWYWGPRPFPPPAEYPGRGQLVEECGDSEDIRPSRGRHQLGNRPGSGGESEYHGCAGESSASLRQIG